jgi:hypothetical protein
MPIAPVTLAAFHLSSLCPLLGGYGLHVAHVADGAAIPGSFWGDSEAGLIGPTLYLRADTPLHSALHEACHFICMDDGRRLRLHTDAGGDVAEENAVCYLQALLADKVTGYGRFRLFGDMDAWGYSFRLGSAQDWFDRDAHEAYDWLRAHRVVDESQAPTGLLRH